MPGEERDDGVVVGTLPVDVDRDAGGVLTRLERLGEQGRVHVPAVGGAVDEDRCRPGVADGVERGREGEAGDEDPVAFPHPKQEQGKMEGSGPAGQGHTVTALGHRRQLGLEGVDLGVRGRSSHSRRPD